MWVSPPAGLDPVMEHAIHHKHPYLNTAFFTWRAVGYFAVWIVVAWLLRSWSLEQDRSGDPGLTLKQRRLGAGALPLLALTMTFASFDWMMSLDPRFFSTIFGVYWFAGGFMCAFAVIIIAAAMTRNDPNGFGHHLSAEHLHSLGKFLLAFTAFWAYIAFSQFMLIWIANVPEEVPWYVLRINGGWKWVGAFLAIFHFLVPFFLLLSRDRKREPVRLARVAVWLLLRPLDRRVLAGHAAPRRRRAAVHAVGSRGVGRRGRRGRGLPHPPHARLGVGAGPRSLPRRLAEVPAAMSDAHASAHGGHEPVRQEDDRIHTPTIVFVGVASLVVFLVASAVAIHYLHGRQAEHGPLAAATEAGKSKIGMVEQDYFDVAVRGERQAASKRERLATWGWVDRDAGTVHMPIDRAMELVSQGRRAGQAAAPGGQP
ncbi:MAG: hypothetical protein QM704_27070 [Anaeromyxobacteraceae bacterium]